jgi:antitoxin component YwqK of YwqJK toxin-antitoxin module
MRQLFLLTVTILLSLLSFSQQLVLVKDSIMNAYMETGFAGKEFRPNGPFDEQNRRTGHWKDYEVIEEGSYQVVDNAPMKTTSMYLFYGEGKFDNDLRTGDWRIFVIEDKTFRKILSRTLTYRKGIPEGPFKYYYPDGKTAQEGFYKAGLIEGPSSMLYPNGKVFGKQIFVAGKKHGRQEYLYQDGKLHFFYDYKNGLRDGAYEAYYPDGKVKESFHNIADSIDGVYRYYYPSGQVWTEKIYKNGRIVNITGTYDKNGKERDKGTLKDGNGYINYYTEDGKIYSVVTYKDGIEIKEENK